MARPTRRRWWSGLSIALIVGLVLACTIREDEFACEDAVSRLKDCCPGFDPSRVDCTFTSGDGCGGDVHPEINPTNASCIRGEACDALQSTGVCARAMKLPPMSQWEANEVALSPDAGANALAEQVCP
jgi:hypothetical protein